LRPASLINRLIGFVVFPVETVRKNNVSSSNRSTSPIRTVPPAAFGDSLFFP
jgi:hypothetical protein